MTTTTPISFEELEHWLKRVRLAAGSGPITIDATYQEITAEWEGPR